MPAIEWKDSSIIKLRPCRVVQESAGRFGIVRRAGMTRVVVREVGVLACEQFRKGCTVGDVKLSLATRFRVSAETVDVAPLLKSLLNADLVASVDGRRLREACPPSLYSAYRYCLRFHLKRRLLHVAYRKLPEALGKTLSHWVHRLDMAAILRPKALRAEEHVRRSPLISTRMRRNFTRRYLKHLIQNIVDFQLLEAMTPAQAERWFDTHLEYEGLDNLAQPKREGLPVIVAGFHFSTTKLLALVLMRRGYDATQVWLPDGSVDMQSVTKWLDELHNLKPEYGRLGLIPDFSLASYKHLLASLRSGSLLVWLADMFSHKEPLAHGARSEEWQEAATRVFGIGQIQTGLAQSKLDVTLCGQRVYVNPWIGGFARIAGAVVVPAALVRQPGGMRLILKPALRLPARATAKHVEDLNRALYAQLDPLLRRYADQWFGWHTLCPVVEQT